MKLSDLTLRSVTFEVRYKDAYILWDRAGSIHKDLAILWPDVRLTEGAPNQQLLKSDDVDIQTGIKASHLTVHYPGTITKKAEQISQTLKTWQNALEFESFERVGTRVIFAKDYKDEATANQAAMEIGLVNFPKEAVFNQPESAYAVDVKLFWQDDVMSTQFALRTEHQSIEISPPREFKESSRKMISHRLVIDVDRGTRKPMVSSKLNVHEWLQGVQHVISRDVDKVFVKHD